jgi:holo-[acyl-carrier protein] synthase
VAVSEVEQAVERFGERYVRRILAPAERTGAAPLTARALAGRVAAKEAVFKVLRPGPADPTPWTDVVVGREATGAPRIELTGHLARLAAAEGIQEVSVSITYAGDYSAAAVVASLRPAHPGSPLT